jgi:hypothetical protein
MPIIHSSTKSEALDDLLQMLLDYSPTSDSTEMNNIYKLSELLSDRFQDIVLPNGTLASSNLGTKHDVSDELTPALYLALEKGDYEALEIMFSLGKGPRGAL